jgi:hypothetical protein
MSRCKKTKPEKGKVCLERYIFEKMLATTLWLLEHLGVSLALKGGFTL